MGRRRGRAIFDGGEPEAFFRCYYEHQLGDVVDTDALFAILKRPLPVTFRVNRTQPGVEAVDADLQGFQGDLTYLDWCDAWQLNVGNVADIKQRTKPGTALHEWRQWLAERGKAKLIERQEVVSMLPVSLLKVEGHHRVLDMCAAPGSKTSQAADMMLARGAKMSKTTDGAAPGCVVANELDARRARILIGRLRPFAQSPALNIQVVNHKAQTIPASLACFEGQENEKGFDRIICDVPCSGDGTLRKNPGLWAHWVPHYGLSLHSTQLQIALRGIALLRVGGRMAYSTCSLNPLENEAVVAALLRQAPVKLVDCSSVLGSLQVLEGLSSWDVVDDTGMVFSSHADAIRRSRPKRCVHRFRKSHFPPSDPARAAELRKCIRVLPHLNNTGGFFVALFERTSDPWPASKSTKHAKKKILDKQRAVRELYNNRKDVTL